MSIPIEKEKQITQEYLKSILHYDEQSGHFTRIKAVSFRVKEGDVAGYMNSNGYTMISVNYGRYRAHRLAFLWMTGEWPQHQVDHINGVRTDNRWVNLRAVTQSINSMNQKISAANTSGCTGVTWCKKNGKWQAQIKKNRKNVTLGRYYSIGDAVAARKLAEKRLGFHQNHGRA